MKKEIFKPLDNIDSKYYITSLGRVFSSHNKIFLKQRIHWKGYLYISLGTRKNRKSYRVHRLVAEYFLQNPENKPQVNHINSNKSDNRVENLEWSTAKENMQHSYKNNRNKIEGEGHHLAKLKEDDVIFIRKSNLKKSVLAKMFNITRSTLGSVVNGKTWKHLL